MLETYIRAPYKDLLKPAKPFNQVHFNFSQADPQKLLSPAFLFVDPGIDDAAMMSHAFIKKLDIRGIMATGGNVPLSQVWENVENICHFLKRDIPLYKGKHLNLHETAEGAHGVGGLGLHYPNCLQSLSDMNPDRPKKSTQDAIDDIRSVLLSTAEEVLIISTGPLTDLADVLAALSSDSQLKPVLSKIKIMMMAGVFSFFSELEPNAPAEVEHAFAEFNIYVDIPASQRCFTLAEQMGLPIYLFALDTTHQTILRNQTDYPLLDTCKDDAVSGENIKILLKDILRDTLIFDEQRFGLDDTDQPLGKPLHDLHTTLALYHQDIYQYISGRVAVDDNGITQFTLGDNAPHANVHLMFFNEYYPLSTLKQQRHIAIERFLKDLE